MCHEWASDFARFLADMGPCPPGRTLDRIDVNGPYSPSNCRWATWREQSRNRQDTVLVEWQGQQMCLKAVAESADVDYKALHARYRYHGESVQQAVAHLQLR